MVTVMIFVAGRIQNHSERGGEEKKVFVHSGNPAPIVRLTWAVMCCCPSSDVEDLCENSRYPGRDSKPKQAGER